MIKQIAHELLEASLVIALAVVTLTLTGLFLRFVLWMIEGHA